MHWRQRLDKGVEVDEVIGGVPTDMEDTASQ